MTTDPKILPQYKGRPVPWITRWTGEIVGKPYTLKMGNDGKLYTTYEDDVYQDKFNGTLWQREGIARSGEPEWKQVNTYRQRYAMRVCACQVCGQKIDDQPVRFLMPKRGGYELNPPNDRHDEVQAITLTAPTCLECIPLALDLCPHLKKYGYDILKVAEYSLWGVYGEIVVFKDGRMGRAQTYIEYDTQGFGPDPGFHMGQVMAKQLVIHLEKYMIEEQQEAS